MKADLILVADMHLREDTPKCRTDDYWQAQARKVQFLGELYAKNDCPVVDAGDMFNTWRPSPRLLAWALTNLPPMYSVPGNHDIPRHNLSLLYKSGFAVMEAGGKVINLAERPRTIQTETDASIRLVGTAYGQDAIAHDDGSYSDRSVLVTHQGVYTGKAPWPGAEKTMASLKKLVDNNPGYDLIVTGHFHIPFAEKVGRTLIVNPGSMMRMTGAQAAHAPRAYLWYAEKNEVDEAPFPIDADVVSREHIEESREKDARLEAFAARVKEDFGADLSFSANLEAYFAHNRTRKSIKDAVYELTDI